MSDELDELLNRLVRAAHAAEAAHREALEVRQEINERFGEGSGDRNGVWVDRKDCDTAALHQPHIYRDAHTDYWCSGGSDE